MTLEVNKKSSVLTDADYKAQKTWTFDEVNLARSVVNLGGPYEGILEAVQNALDSPNDPEKDYNRIDITLPLIGDSEYKQVVARVRDLGGSVTKLTNGNISEFLNAKKAVSLKGNERFGIGMVQFPNVSQAIILVSQDDKFIYRLPILKDNDGLPAWGSWTLDTITPENQKKFNIFHKGSVLTFYDPYQDMPDLDAFKLGKQIQKVFGWKMLQRPNTEIYINEVRLEIPDELTGREIIWICNLKSQVVRYQNGRSEKINPVVEGFIYGDKKGTGSLRLYAGGGYYITTERFADKRFTGAINIIGMPVDTSRNNMTNEAMKLDLYKHIIDLTKGYPDLPKEGEEIDEKHRRSLNDFINKVVGQFNIPKRVIQNLQTEKKKKEEQLGNKGLCTTGYPKPKDPMNEVVEICDLCGHYKLKNTKGEREGCECKCHIPRKKGPNKKVGQVVLDENGNPVLVEKTENSDMNKRSELKTTFPDEMLETDPFVSIRPTGVLAINKKNPIWDAKFFFKNPKALLPYLAPVIMDLEHPQALGEMNTQDFRKTQEDYVIKMLGAA